MDFDYMSFYQTIDGLMLEQYKSLNKKTNPVYINHKDMMPTQLTTILSQYSLFPRHIVPMLVQCFYSSRYQRWNDIADELLLNIKQELGDDPFADDYNIPQESYTAHYVLLRRSMLSTFCVDISLINPHPITLKFIETITNEAKSCNPYYSLGVAAALETSANPELWMVYRMVKNLAEKSSLNISNDLSFFFEAHIHPIETGHRDRLLKLVFKLICNNDASHQQSFFDGLCVVFQSMDKWWDGLFYNH